MLELCVVSSTIFTYVHKVKYKILDIPQYILYLQVYKVIYMEIINKLLCIKFGNLDDCITNCHPLNSQSNNKVIKVF